MSALSVPVNPVLPQAAPTPQSTTAADQQSPAFASVLKQKQQSQGDKNDSNTQSSAQNPPPSNATPAPATQSAAAGNASNTKDDGKTDTAADAGYAQTALQLLLPWLQAAQGQTASNDPKATDKSPSVTTTDAATLPQSVLPMTTPVASRSASSRDIAADATETAVATTKTSTDAANATAKLAVPEAVLAADDKHKSAAGNFDAALNNADAARQAAAQTPASGTQAATARAEPTQMQSPVGTPQWQTELGERVQLMTRNNESRAELVLTPPQLGRVEVSLHISGDQASATFISANPEVRTALEQSMEHLRAVLANSGIALGQAQVGAESSGQAFAGSQSRQSGNSRSGSGDDSVQATASAGANWTRHSNNMLDVFA